MQWLKYVVRARGTVFSLQRVLFSTKEEESTESLYRAHCSHTSRAAPRKSACEADNCLCRACVPCFRSADKLFKLREEVRKKEKELQQQVNHRNDGLMLMLYEIV